MAELEDSVEELVVAAAEAEDSPLGREDGAGIPDVRGTADWEVAPAKSTPVWLGLGATVVFCGFKTLQRTISGVDVVHALALTHR